jgi:hypothetical protein
MPEIILHWTDEEEKAFADIQACSRLNRIQSIQLWKRVRKNTEKAIRIAKLDYAPVSERQQIHLVKMNAASVAAAKRRKAIKCATLPNAVISDSASHHTTTN